MKFLLDTNVFVHLGNQSRGWVGIAQRIRAVGIEQCAALVMHTLERGGKVNNWPDVMIAGQSIAAGRVLVTDDAALLALPQVKAENWRASSL